MAAIRLTLGILIQMLPLKNAKCFPHSNYDVHTNRHGNLRAVLAKGGFSKILFQLSPLAAWLNIKFRKSGDFSLIQYVHLHFDEFLRLSKCWLSFLNFIKRSICQLEYRKWPT
jgi:hypothetical protein